MASRIHDLQWEHRKTGLGILAARLTVALQEELYARLAQAGHGQLTHLHGAVIAHLDEGGTRATEIARRSGRHKQVIGRLVDELEQLGYVGRRQEPHDRRGKLIVPTSRGIEVMRLSDDIVGDIERRQARLLGRARWNDFRKDLLAVVESISQPSDRGSSQRQH